MDVNALQSYNYFENNIPSINDYYNRFYYVPMTYYSSYKKDNTEVAMKIAQKIIKRECLKMTVVEFCNLVNCIKEEL